MKMASNDGSVAEKTLSHLLDTCNQIIIVVDSEHQIAHIARRVLDLNEFEDYKSQQRIDVY